MLATPQKISVPIGCTYFAGTDEAEQPKLGEWNRLQSLLGNSFVRTVLSAPEMRGDPPVMRSFESSISCKSDEKSAAECIGLLLFDWRLGIETIMNRRWSLCENPYALAWFLPGAILLHEDPLGWVIDAHGEDILSQAFDLEDGRDPTWTLIRPLPESKHEQIRQMHSTDLPLAEEIDGYLNDKAQKVGLFGRTIPGLPSDALKDTHLSWSLQPGHFSILTRN